MGHRSSVPKPTVSTRSMPSLVRIPVRFAHDTPPDVIEEAISHWLGKIREIEGSPCYCNKEKVLDGTRDFSSGDTFYLFMTRRAFQAVFCRKAERRDAKPGRITAESNIESPTDLRSLFDPGSGEFVPASS